MSHNLWHVSSWMGRLATDRVAALREFLLTWYGGPDVLPATADVPAPLAALYAVAAGRPEVLGTQNAVYPPSQLRTDPDEGLLVFAAENQGTSRGRSTRRRTIRRCGWCGRARRRWPNGSR